MSFRVRGKKRGKFNTFPFSLNLFFIGCEMNSNKKLGLVLLIFCLLMWFFIIPTQVMGVREMIYPRFITIWIAISGFLLILQSRKDASKEISHEFQDKKKIARVIVIITTFLIYILIIDFLGFFISSFLFLVMAMLVLGVRDWRILVLMPVMLLLFLYLFIEKLIVFPLPKGKIF